MRTKGLLKKTVTIFTCLALMLSAFGFSGMTALAGESAASAESESTREETVSMGHIIL